MRTRLLAFTLAVITFALAMAWPAAAEDRSITLRGHGQGGGINLAFAPPDLQACFGSSGWFNWFVQGGTAHLNAVGPTEAHFSANGQLTANVTNEAGDVVYAGARNFAVSEVAAVDPGTGDAEIITPLMLDLTAEDGAVLHVTLAFRNGIHSAGGSVAINYMFALLEYSDIICTR